MKSLSNLSSAVGSMRATRCRRAILVIAISMSSMVGLSALGMSQASATTSAESTSYDAGPCVQNDFGVYNVYCLPSRLTSTGAEFKFELLGDPENAGCFSDISWVDGAGFYLEDASWYEGSGGTYLLDPSGYGDWFDLGSVSSGLSEQVVDQFCTLDFNVTY